MAANLCHFSHQPRMVRVDEVAKKVHAPRDGTGNRVNHLRAQFDARDQGQSRPRDRVDGLRESTECVVVSQRENIHACVPCVRNQLTGSVITVGCRGVSVKVDR